MTLNDTAERVKKILEMQVSDYTADKKWAEKYRVQILEEFIDQVHLVGAASLGTHPMPEEWKMSQELRKLL